MAVIAVGDFDKAAIEALIRSHFGVDPGAAVSEAAAERTPCRISQARDTRSRPTPRRPSTIDQRLQHDGRPRSDDRSAPTGSRWSSGCSAACCPRRFAEIAQKPNAPFLDAETEPRPLRATRRRRRR